MGYVYTCEAALFKGAVFFLLCILAIHLIRFPDYQFWRGIRAVKNYNGFTVIYLCQQV